MKKIVIFGAGQTGRGYVVRCIDEPQMEISFIDNNKSLISKINSDQFYSIHFYKKDRTPFLVETIKGYHIEDDISLVLEEADIILTSVGEQNLLSVAETIKNNWKSNKQLPQFLTCENGINPGKVLHDSLVKLFGDQFEFNVSQTAVFCSTINLDTTRLDILSQNIDHFPYDGDHYKGDIQFRGGEKINDFEKYLKRKIYTYNCFAGVISYMGYIKGYELFADAANDEEILRIIDELQVSLNPSLAKYFDISLDEQKDFSNKAMIKFQDRSIIDYCLKNGRAAKRKLGKTERIYAPYSIIKSNELDTEVLPMNAAAALIYWDELQGISEPDLPINHRQILSELLEISEEDSYIEKVLYYYNKIKENREDLKLLSILEK